jgi:methyl-accepting chemotaxis protein
MKNKAHERRRVRVVRMGFQRNFILKFCAIIILASLIIAGIVYGLTMTTATTAFENSRLVIKRTSDFLLPLLLFSSLVAIIATGLMTIITTLFVSFHIAGPLYRLEKDMAEANKGNLGVEIRLRNKDELKDLAQALNQLVRFFRETVTEIDKDIVGIPADNLSGEGRQKLENIKSRLRKFSR